MRQESKEENNPPPAYGAKQRRSSGVGGEGAIDCWGNQGQRRARVSKLEALPLETIPGLPSGDSLGDRQNKDSSWGVLRQGNMIFDTRETYPENATISPSEITISYFTANAVAYLGKKHWARSLCSQYGLSQL